MPNLNLYPNGAGETLGGNVITEKSLYTTGHVWYVDSTNGTDAASPAGKNRNDPIKTLAQAHTNAADGDIIVLMDGFAETLTAAQTISKKVTIAGAGQSSGKPTCKLTLNAAAANMLTITTSDVELNNIWIEENSQSNTSEKIELTGSDFQMIGCYVEANGNDTKSCLRINTGAHRARIENCTFISTGTSGSSQPKAAVEVIAAVNNLDIVGTVFSGGTYGWSAYQAFIGVAAVTRFRMRGVSLLLGADMKFDDASTGRISIPTSTGSAKIDWETAA